MRSKQNGFGAPVIVLTLLIVGIVGVLGAYLWQKGKSDTQSNTDQNSSTQEKTTASFETPKKGAHFESSTPAHGMALAANPPEVVIDFNFDLASNSTIKINKDGKDYGTGGTTVDSNKLVLRRKMDPTAPDGVYTVNYTGCWPDRTCHDGHFQFAVNRSLLDSYNDHRGQKTITIKLSDIKFEPMNIRVSQGTTITWINDDSLEHYVNTDSHPAHTHVPDFNSRALQLGQSFSFTFADKGAYPYHCSAHADSMVGNIIVE